MTSTENTDAVTFTHAARYRIADVDAAGLLAFAVRGNHCPCEAVRFGGIVVYQCAGFDGPHLFTEYHAVRESDGALVDVWTLLDDGPGHVEVAAFRADVTFADPDGAAAAVTRAMPLRPTTGDTRRLRFDPHPAGTCWACR